METMPLEIAILIARESLSVYRVMVMVYTPLGRLSLQQDCSLWFKRIDKQGFTYLNEDLHSFNDECAVYEHNGVRYWYYVGSVHRVNNPAIVRENGASEWYHFGMRHRIDGPAVVRTNGASEWYHFGERHRVDGPAVVCADGNCHWYHFGVCHRIDGPAVVCADGNCEWWEYGRRIRSKDTRITKSEDRAIA